MSNRGLASDDSVVKGASDALFTEPPELTKNVIILPQSTNGERYFFNLFALLRPSFPETFPLLRLH